MNIQRLISKVRKARKIRQVFLFHDKPRPGIDVPDDDWDFALKTLARAFKYYKAAGCSIEVSWWGEVFVALPDYLIPFEMSIHHRPTISNIEKVAKEASENLFSIISNANFNNSLVISVRPLRQRAKWQSFELNDENESIGVKTYDHIYRKISSYGQQESNELEQLKKVTTEDVVAVIKLGSVILANSYCFQCISTEVKKQIFVKALTIEDSIISMGSYVSLSDTEYHLGNKELIFLQKYLPSNMFRMHVGQFGK